MASLLFVSGVAVGGAARSTLQLAEALSDRGHAVTVVLTTRGAGVRWTVYDLLVKVWVKSQRLPTAPLLRMVLRIVGRGAARASDSHGVRIVAMGAPECHLHALVREHRPDVVVVNSVWRAAWQWIHSDAQALGIPLALYIREEHGRTHLTHSRLPPDRVIANAEAHRTRLRTSGWDCDVIPSLVDRDVSSTISSRRVVLLVNPDHNSQPEVLFGLAREHPDIPFVVQESWPLAQQARAALEEEVIRHPNVELRAFEPDPARIYRDAKVLLAPYLSGRPRVVAEAQHNGIPVLGSKTPELQEGVGEGGLLVDLGASISEWSAALAAMWNDDQRYASLCEAALAHDRRAELDAEAIVSAFERLVEEMRVAV